MSAALQRVVALQGSTRPLVAAELRRLCEHAQFEDDVDAYLRERADVYGAHGDPVVVVVALALRCALADDEDERGRLEVALLRASADVEPTRSPTSTIATLETADGETVALTAAELEVFRAHEARRRRRERP